MEATISYARVVLFIVALRLPAYISLILGAIIVGILSPHVGDGNVWVVAVETSMKEFGITAGKVSFVIAIASVLGVAMTESGAAERIVNQLIKAFGESRAAIALLVAGFILSIPVFDAACTGACTEDRQALLTIRDGDILWCRYYALHHTTNSWPDLNG